MTKHWWESWTIIFNIAALLFVAPEILAVIPAAWHPYATALVAGVNIVLRYAKTSTALK